MAKFKAGDKVIHTSGHGPSMVVSSAFLGVDSRDNRIEICECEYWSAAEEKFVRESFPETSLELEDEGDGDF